MTLRKKDGETGIRHCASSFTVMAILRIGEKSIYGLQKETLKTEIGIKNIMLIFIILTSAMKLPLRTIKFYMLLLLSTSLQPRRIPS